MVPEVYHMMQLPSVCMWEYRRSYPAYLVRFDRSSILYIALVVAVPRRCSGFGMAYGHSYKMCIFAILGA
jgi:hypothetical protein